MAEVCLIYLNQFNDESLIWNEYLRRPQFLFYAGRQWYFHYDNMPAEEEENVIDLLLTFINTHHYGYAFGNWLGLLDYWYVSRRRSLAPLAALSYFGCHKAVRAIAEYAAEVHVTEDAIKESLHCASIRGYKAVLQVLLDARARLNSAGIVDASPLRWALREAIMRGHTEIIELLISKGATAKGDYSIVSRIAASQGKIHMVKLFLDCSTRDRNKLEAFYGALQAAIAARQSSIIEYLMERSAEIDIFAGGEDLYFATLQTAFFQRDGPILQSLIDRAFGLDAKNIRRAKLKVLDTAWTPRTRLVMLQILGAGTDHPLLERNHERDYIPSDDVYWQNAVEIELTIKETLLEERKLLEEEELIKEATDLLQRIRGRSTVASHTIETESDDMDEKESNDIDETESDDINETESDDMAET